MTRRTFDYIVVGVLLLVAALLIVALLVTR